MQVTKLSLVFHLDGDEPNRPQTLSGPYPYATEEISFNNGGIALHGTLVLPEGYSRETPALIMITGSGVQDRDEELFDHRPFAVIADALARAGIATLRYDDRGYGGYDGDINACTVDDFKVGAIGHSEGGTIATRNGLTANPANRIETVEGLNHLFQHCTTGAVTEYREIEETFSHDVLGQIIIWITDSLEICLF